MSSVANHPSSSGFPPTPLAGCKKNANVRNMMNLQVSAAQPLTAIHWQPFLLPINDCDLPNTIRWKCNHRNFDRPLMKRTCVNELLHGRSLDILKLYGSSC
ncbi:hypothetical protein TESG_05964 [Trichophyton tonsurans CBS 112818]|uniref:Uncharacterized protein n=1 Tax=Trichophyton tonsurans (strain CBS 112818) TaxID=647933 RepID=F2S4P4_TRIT1|nr:hypothetical protein TESG_05964 [Trichophyton tonsurans CBS 112818]